MKALADMLPQLQALIEKEADSDITSQLKEPLIDEDFIKSVADFGTFAKHRLF
jgi:hypothetical protein